MKYTIHGMTKAGKRTKATVDAESYDEALMQASVLASEIPTLKFVVIHNE